MKAKIIMEPGQALQYNDVKKYCIEDNFLKLYLSDQVIYINRDKINSYSVRYNTLTFGEAK